MENDREDTTKQASSQPRDEDATKQEDSTIGGLTPPVTSRALTR